MHTFENQHYTNADADRRRRKWLSDNISSPGTWSLWAKNYTQLYEQVHNNIEYQTECY